jgi:signal transduction histidine kinase
MVCKGWEFVEKNQERISSLVMDMLTFSKEREPELLPSNLNNVTLDVVELMQSRAKERSVELNFAPAADMPQLTFDPEGLHRAVLNVLTNAIDACDKELTGREDVAGRVNVWTEFQAGSGLARVIVEDNGDGIAAEDLENIFSLFVSHKGSRGTGLGLPVSQKIMKEHGGRIDVESQPGKGSRFMLELPAVYAELSRQTSSVPEMPTE